MKEKLGIFGEELRKNRITILMLALVITVVGLIAYSFKAREDYRHSLENNYNMAFSQLVDDVQNVEVYLAKSIISNSPESGIKTLSYVWREANMAETYLAMLPISSEQLENTSKFLNQVSDYSYSLSRKAMNNESLTQEELDNLDMLHDHSLELKNTLNQLSTDIYSGKISWQELTQKITPTMSKQVSNISKDSFNSVEENFHEYAGLIYDGAFSEHMTNPERRGLTGDDIDESKAKSIAKEFCKDKDVKEIVLNGISENGNIEAYNYTITTNNNNTIWISVSKKGGHVVSMNSNRDVNAEAIAQEEIDQKAQKYLEEKGFFGMKKTYFSKNSGIETINYAYQQDDIIMYPDLIKLKVALDNGEILGFETTGYLNSHTERNVPQIKVTEEEALQKINEKLQIQSSRLAVIPTEFKTELTCWEIKGNVDDRDFLVYINVETGKEEDILVILNSAEGTLTM